MTLLKYSKNILLYVLLILITNSLKSQTLLLYGNLNTNDIAILKEICNTLIKENKKPLKSLQIEFLNSDSKQSKTYNKVSNEKIDGIIEDVYTLLKTTKPKEENFKSKINALPFKQDLIVIEKPTSRNPLKIDKSKKLKKLIVALNFYKKPVSIISTNIKNKQEFSIPIKTIKLNIENNEEIEIKKVIYKINNSKINSTDKLLFSDENASLSFQLIKINSKPFNISIAIVTEEDDTSEFANIKDLKFLYTENEYNAEIYGITKLTPAVLRCKKQISENQGSLRYLFKLLLNKDFDINQIVINLKIIEDNGSQRNYFYPLRKLNINDYSLRNFNNDFNIACIYIDPLKMFSTNCDSDGVIYGEYSYRVSITNDSEYLSIFEPNKIRNNEISTFCQGFDGSVEEFKILPLCNCD